MRRIALVLLLACSKKSEQAAPAKLDKLVVTLDGKPLAIDRAFIKRPSADVHAVFLGAGNGSCTDEPRFGFTILKRVAATGHERYFVTDVWSRDVDVKATTPVTAELVDNKVKVDVGGANVAIRGEFEAIACPDVPPTGMGVPKTTHRSAGTITVASKRLDIKGVTVQTRPGVAATDLPNIVISTSVKDCSSVTMAAPVILERTDGKWSMHGTWFTDTLTETAPTTLTFNANSVGKTTDGPTLDLQLSGTGKLGDYTVKLEGAGVAIECVR